MSDILAYLVAGASAIGAVLVFILRYFKLTSDPKARQKKLDDKRAKIDAEARKKLRAIDERATKRLEGIDNLEAKDLERAKLDAAAEAAAVTEKIHAKYAKLGDDPDRIRAHLLTLVDSTTDDD